MNVINIFYWLSNSSSLPFQLIAKHKKLLISKNSPLLSDHVSVISVGLSVSARRPWGSYTKPEIARGGGTQKGRPESGLTFVSQPSLSWPLRSIGSSSHSLSLERGQPTSAPQTWERVQASSISRWLSNHILDQPHLASTTVSGLCILNLQHYPLCCCYKGEIYPWRPKQYL